jgi:hypothetical protein
MVGRERSPRKRVPLLGGIRLTRFSTGCYLLAFRDEAVKKPLAQTTIVQSSTKQRSRSGMVQLGEKHECDDCGIKVYDLGRPQALCPRCGRDLKSTASKRRAEEPAPRPRAAPAPEPEIEEPPVESGEADDLDDDLAADEELELVEGEAPEGEAEEAEPDDDE